MRLPSWSEFKEKLSNFEKDVNKKIIKFKGDYPLLDKAIHQSLGFLPPPFNGIAQNIYDSFEGSEEDKGKAVLEYLNELKDQGQEHYEIVSNKLDNVLIGVKDLKELGKNQTKIVLQIKDTLVSKIDNVDQKIDELKLDINAVGTIVGEVRRDVLKNQEKLDESLANQRKILELLRIEKNISKKEINTKEHEQRFEELHKKIERFTVKLEEANQKPAIDPDFVLREGNFYYYAKKFDRAIGLYDLILKEDPDNVVAKKNLEITVGKFEKLMGASTKEWKDRNVNMSTLIEKIKQFLKDDGLLEINHLSSEKKHTIVAQPKKPSFFRRYFIGTRIGVHIIINGTSNHLSIKIGPGEENEFTAKNMAIRYFIGKFPGLIRMNQSSRFMKKLWRFIEKEIDKPSD